MADELDKLIDKLTDREKELIVVVGDKVAEATEERIAAWLESEAGQSDTVIPELIRGIASCIRNGEHRAASGEGK